MTPLYPVKVVNGDFAPRKNKHETAIENTDGVDLGGNFRKQSILENFLCLSVSEREEVLNLLNCLFACLKGESS